MRLPRLTTRRLMVLVAVVALALFVVHLRRLSVDYEQRAAVHEADELSWRSEEAWLSYMAMKVGVPQGEVEKARRLSGHHAELKRKYEYAARYPWLPVPPDPPPPE